MKGAAHTLEAALAAMSFVIEPERYALLGSPEPLPLDLLVGLEMPWQVIREGGESTLLVPERLLEPLLERLPGARVERDLLWVRFEAAMGWEVVGFLARVTGALAEAGIPLGAVCGYSRDHLFLAARHEARTREVLDGLFRRR